MTSNIHLDSARSDKKIVPSEKFLHLSYEHYKVSTLSLRPLIVHGNRPLLRNILWPTMLRLKVLNCLLNVLKTKTFFYKLLNYIKLSDIISNLFKCHFSYNFVNFKCCVLRSLIKANIFLQN